MPSGSRFKVAIKREQNKFIYYVEREQLRRGQDDKVGLKEKGEIHHLRLTNGKVKTEKSKVLSTPSASLVHPVSGGQSAGAVLALVIVRSLWIPRASAALIPAQASHSKEKNL